MLNTCPMTDVILKCALRPLKVPSYSCTSSELLRECNCSVITSVAGEGTRLMMYARAQVMLLDTYPATGQVLRN